MNFAGTRAKNLSVNPEKSQGESDRQTVEDVGPELIVHLISK